MVSGPPLSPPKPLEIKSPNTWYTREKCFYTTAYTHDLLGTDPRKETTERPQNTHTPNTRVRENDAGK